MGFNFPNNPAPGQVYTGTGGYSYVFLDGVWRVVQPTQAYVPMAQTRNRIVNPAMQISQQNGDAAAAGVAAASYFMADQWGCSHGSAGSPHVQRYGGFTSPYGSKYRLLADVGAIDASPAGTDYYGFFQAIEGVRVADFQWGTSNAKQVVLRVGTRHGIAGTYGGSINNPPQDRSYVFSYVVAAGDVDKDIYRTFVIPGDATGTWPNDTGIGLYLYFTFMATPTYLKAPGSWNAGGFFAPTGQANGMATTSKQSHIFDVGLYLDPDKTGVAPPWTMPDEAQELIACQRYYEKSSGVCIIPPNLYQTYAYKVTKRAQPAVSYYSVSGGAMASTSPGLDSFQCTNTVLANFGFIVNARL